MTNTDSINKVDTRDIYNRFMYPYRSLLNTVDKQLSDARGIKFQIQKYFYTKRKFIEKDMKYNFRAFVNKDVRTPQMDKFVDDKAKEFLNSHNKFYVNYISIVKANETYYKLQKKQKEIKSKIIDYKVFLSILDTFNEMIVDEIIKGKEFNLGNGLSKIYIIKKFNENCKRVDWGESNAYKKQLIEEGKIPYKALEFDEEGKVTKDNGGVKWHIKHDQTFNNWVFWGRGSSSLVEAMNYSFKPTRGDFGFVKKLNQYNEYNPNNHLNYRSYV